MANVWHPIRGITIIDMSEGRFRFRSYHKVDANRIEAGGPWNFNSYFLVLYRLSDGILIFDCWFRICLTILFQMGNFIEKLLKYDGKPLSLSFGGTMRVRVRFYIRKPLKRKKKIALPNSSLTYVTFANEKLTLFCFFCERLRYGESFCP